MLRGRSGCSSCGHGLRLSGLVERELAVDLELDFLADQKAAASEGNVPREAPVRAIHGPGEGATNLGVAERIDDRAAVLVVEGDLLGQAVDRQVAGEPALVTVGGG